MPDSIFLPSSGGSSEVLRKRIVLTDAQIKTLNTVPVIIVAAPGAGKMLSPDILWCIKESTAGAYSLNSTIRLRWTGLTTDLVTASNMQLAVTNKVVARFDSPAAGFAALNPFNLGLEISSSGDVTGGNAANYMVCEVVYTITVDGP